MAVFVRTHFFLCVRYCHGNAMVDATTIGWRLPRGKKYCSTHYVRRSSLEFIRWYKIPCWKYWSYILCEKWLFPASYLDAVQHFFLSRGFLGFLQINAPDYIISLLSQSSKFIHTISDSGLKNPSRLALNITIGHSWFFGGPLVLYAEVLTAHPLSLGGLYVALRSHPWPFWLFLQTGLERRCEARQGRWLPCGGGLRSWRCGRCGGKVWEGRCFAGPLNWYTI